MKFAFIVNEFPAVSETFILNQIVELINDGHDVTIYAERKRSEAIIHEDYKNYDLLNKVKYFDMPQSKIKRILTFFFENKKISNKDKWKFLNFIKYGRDVINLRAYYLARVFDSNENYDSVICHFGPNGLLFSRVKEVLGLNENIVTIFHGYDLTKIVNQKGKKYYNTLFENGNSFLAVNKMFKDILIKLGSPEANTHVFHMGVKTIERHFEVKDAHNTKMKILSVGRFVEKKGFKYAVHSMTDLKMRMNDFEYNIIGHGPEFDEVNKFISEKNLTDNVKLLGWQDKNIVKNYMMNSDVLLVPSITAEDGDKEGIPMVIMEAIAFGLPVIATDHSGIPELIIHEKTGLLIPEKNGQQIVKSLIDIKKDSNSAMRRANRAIELLNAEFNLKKQNNLLISILKDDKKHAKNL